MDQREKTTLDYYDKNAESFWQGTRDHDVSQNIDAFLQAMPKNKSLDILDFGCGPGRDVFRFKALGHKPVGLDGSQEFCRMARQYSGSTVLHQNFLNLNLEAQSFDGIFANASLFHIPRQALSNVLLDLHSALKPEGILFASIPRGNNEEWRGERYGHYMELEVMTPFLEQSGFKILHHYYRPVGLPLEQQSWLAVVCQKRCQKQYQKKGAMNAD